VATKTSDPRQLFLHELGDVLTAEKTIVKMLPRLQKEASDKKLANGLEQHLKQSRDHVANVEKAFKAIGEKPQAQRCPGIEGIRVEHEAAMKETRPAPEIADLVVAGSAARTEHYEIAVYEGLVNMARTLGEPEAARLLGENLKQDKQMLKEATAISKELGKKAKKQAKEVQKAATGGRTRPIGGARARAGARTQTQPRASSTTRRRARS
jgi:ferritin-like metal-binding protein YciE